VFITIKVDFDICRPQFWIIPWTVESLVGGIWAYCAISKLLKQGNIQLKRIKSEYTRLVVVDEGRKRVILIAACILAARKLSQWDGRNSPASESAISDAIALAERIMSRVSV
jgi:hypothetical protein